MGMKMRLATVLFFVVGSFAATPFLNVYLDPESRESLRNVFEQAIAKNQISSIHYGVSGLKALGVAMDAAKTQAACEMAKKVDGNDLAALYHATSAAADLAGCTLPAIKGAKEAIDGASTAAKPTSQNLFFALTAAQLLKMKVNEEAFVNALNNAMKDDSAMSLANGLNAASLLSKANAEKFVVRVEDLIGQADEVDGKYLQLEGGLSVTALGIHGIYALADKVNKSPSVKSDEAVKLASYILSRRSVHMDRAAYLLVVTLRKLALNNFQVPVVFSLASNMAVTDAAQPIRIRVSNVLGETVGALSVNLDAATNVASKEVVTARKALTRVANDATNTLYEVKLEEAVKRGFYNLALTAGSQDKRLVGTNGASLVVKLLSKVRVEDVSVAVFDRDLSKAANVNSVKEASKLGKVLDVDTHSKMEIKFVVKEAKTGNAVSVHQAFVAFVHSTTKQEIIFVATADRSNAYTFDIDLEKSAKDFDGLSGKYAVRLIIGDAAISNALDWNLVDVNMKLPEAAAAKVKKSEQIIYEKLPEISHLFREPEKRPAQVLSDTFTVLCLIPLLILLIVWLRIGINFGNMPLSPWTLAFHAGLIGIFGLYVVFWLRLNMFETLKYLSCIGALTFIAGNRLLRAIAAKRKEKTE